MEYRTPGYENLELSTQMIIKEALKRGYVAEVLDPEDNFIRLSGNERTEYIKQATRTRVDSYITPLIMENKQVSKIIMSEAGISVPKGDVHSNIEDLLASFDFWEKRAFVLKPNSTNFGTAVAMFPKGATKEEFHSAAKEALDIDNKVLIEEIAEGKEYRFLVIGDYVRAVLHRVPANIKGDGISNIEELIKIKNKNPLRQKGYVSPLEKISLGNTEMEFLKAQGLTVKSIPEKDRVIFLRKNSNISTGGDSIDFTDSVHSGYKDLAIAAAKSVGAKICGVDLIAKDIRQIPNDENYSIIELNFNPALHIHDFPAEGLNRKTAQFVLDLLEL